MKSDFIKRQSVAIPSIINLQSSIYYSATLAAKLLEVAGFENARELNKPPHGSLREDVESLRSA